MGNNNIIEVAAAVLHRPDGACLLAQRPKDKIWAGYWEFPGGKVEAGETSRHALVRELKEELGIEVKTSYPWITRIFNYPHATVKLNFFRVTEWSGELHPHEGQQFAWQQVADIRVHPVLPANAPVIRLLTLPSFYAISNVKELGEDDFMRRLEGRLRKGLRLVQLREKGLSHDATHALALRMKDLLHEYDAKLILNSDIELALEIGADGVQLTSSQIETLRERPSLPWCGASCHNKKELRWAEALGCDFALISPVQPTPSHPGEPTLGWEKFSSIVNGSSIPIYALGGLTESDMRISWQYGAHGIALLRQAWVS